MVDVWFGAVPLLEESVRGIIGSPGETAVEPTIVNLVSWLKLSIELTGANFVEEVRAAGTSSIPRTAPSASMISRRLKGPTRPSAP